MNSEMITNHSSTMLVPLMRDAIKIFIESNVQALYKEYQLQ